MHVDTRPSIPAHRCQGYISAHTNTFTPIVPRSRPLGPGACQSLPQVLVLIRENLGIAKELKALTSLARKTSFNFV